MSVEAMTWVLKDAPDVPPQLVSTLIGIANHAAPDGRNAYPSHLTLAAYTRKSDRQVRRDVAELVKRGLIRRGDQRIVAHLPLDRRPVVYDLAMSDLDGGSPTSPRTPTTGRPRPVTDDRSSTSGGTPVTERGDVGDRNGGSPTSAKPSFEPSRTVPKKDTPVTPAKPRADRGTRLPDGFAVTDDMATWARANTPDCGPADHDAFCDYWRSIPGAKGRKVDWPATWRNWMRREQDRREGTRPKSSSANTNIDRRQQHTDGLFDRAMERARFLDAQEAHGEP